MKRAFALGAVAAATVLALAGCAGHGRVHTALQPAGQPAATGTQRATSTTPATGPDASTFSSVDTDLTALDHSLAGINSQITDADKAADDDN